MIYTCPVCYYGEMPDPPSDYNICPCCGTEFQNHDEDYTHAELRAFWIDKGMIWFFRTPPPNWNPYRQLAEAGVPIWLELTAVPRFYGGSVEEQNAQLQGEFLGRLPDLLAHAG